jgi:ubiquinone/menaquinone biosynthesis C-methylase UbiE
MSGRSINERDQAIKGKKTESLIYVIKQRAKTAINSVLVVGCGAGHEAGVLAREFESNAIGIDMGDEFAFDNHGSAPAKLMIMDARELQFPDGTFDLVYSFHALEHIPGPERALKEMARVLRSGGMYLIGTPNKKRLVGYVGSATTTRNKILWNLKDFAKRVKGQWSNEDGAHAGFTQHELMELCRAAFGGNPISVADTYYEKIYGRLASGIRGAHLSSLVYPCVYVLGNKP